jgi:hypothetical protein
VNSIHFFVASVRSVDSRVTESETHGLNLTNDKCVYCDVLCVEVQERLRTVQ